MAIIDTFPLVNNEKIYKSKHSIPYYEVYTVDTPYTVDFDGFYASYFGKSSFNFDETDEGTFLWIGKKSKVGFFSGHSWPLEIAPYYKKYEQFAIIHSGILNLGSSAILYIKGTGRVQYDFKFSGPFTGNIYDLSSNPGGMVSIHLDNIENQFFRLRYLSPSKYSDDQNVLSVSWSNSTHTTPVPLTAYRINGGSSPSRDKLNNISDVKLNRTEKKVSVLNFTVPLVSSTASVGYKYIANGDYLEDVDSGAQIKKFRKIEFNAGYKCNSTTATIGYTISTIRKFTGQVRSWKVNRGFRGNTVEIECHDWMSFLTDTINEGSPNLMDYFTYGYLDTVEDTGALDSMPMAYDGWKMEDVVENLLYNAYIDPEIISQRQDVIDFGGDSIEGFYLFAEKNSTTKVRLDKSFHFGNPNATGKDADSEYIWKLSVGDSIFDCIQKIMDNYGYTWGFNNYGYFYTNSVKNPLVTKSIDDMTFNGSWTENTDVGMLYAVSKETQVNDDYVDTTFTGLGCHLIYNRAPGYGTINVKLIKDDSSEVVNSGDISSNYDKVWNFFDGVDDDVGYNPCKVWVGTDENNYGDYRLRVTKIGGGTISINAVFVYGNNEEDPVDTFYSGDDGTNLGVLVDSLSSSSSADDIRNDVVVVGRLKTVTPQLDTDDVEIVNPNNPISDHVLARALDRYSISKSSSVNYTGRQLQTIIIEPKISNLSKATWLASETAKRYNRFNKVIQPMAKIVGQPLLEVGDKVKIEDSNLGVLGTLHTFWVQGLTDEYTRGEYTTNLKLTSFEPWDSYFSYPIPSIGRFGSPFVDVKIHNTGIGLTNVEQTFIGSSENSNYTGFATIDVNYSRNTVENNEIVKLDTITSTIVERIPSMGFMKISKPYDYTDPDYNYATEIIKYEHVEVKPSTDELTTAIFRFTGLTRGYYNTCTIDLANEVDDYINPRNVSAFDYPSFVELQVDPYSIDEFNGLSPSVTFDLLFTGFVRVSVLSSTDPDYNHANGILVARLTRDESNDDFVRLEPGTYVYNWGLIDEYGQYNEENFGTWKHQGQFSRDFPNLDGSVSDDGNADWDDKHTTCNDDLYGSLRHKIGRGYYVANSRYSKYGKFQFKLEFIDPDGLVENSTKFTDFIYTVMRYDGSLVFKKQRRLLNTFSYLVECHLYPESSLLDSEESTYPSISGVRTGFYPSTGPNYVYGSNHTWDNISGIDPAEFSYKEGNYVSPVYVCTRTRDPGFYRNGIPYITSRTIPFHINNYYNFQRTLSVSYTGTDHICVYGKSSSNLDVVVAIKAIDFNMGPVTKTIIKDSNLTFNINLPDIPYMDTDVLTGSISDIPFIAVTHAIVILIKVTDMSGRSQYIGQSFFYIDNSFSNDALVIFKDDADGDGHLVLVAEKSPITYPYITEYKYGDVKINGSSMVGVPIPHDSDWM